MNLNAAALSRTPTKNSPNPTYEINSSTEATAIIATHLGGQSSGCECSITDRCAASPHSGHGASGGVARKSYPHRRRTDIAFNLTRMFHLGLD